MEHCSSLSVWSKIKGNAFCDGERIGSYTTMWKLVDAHKHKSLVQFGTLVLSGLLCPAASDESFSSWGQVRQSEARMLSKTPKWPLGAGAPALSASTLPPFNLPLLSTSTWSSSDWRAWGGGGLLFSRVLSPCSPRFHARALGSARWTSCCHTRAMREACGGFNCWEEETVVEIKDENMKSLWRGGGGFHFVLRDFSQRWKRDETRRLSAKERVERRPPAAAERAQWPASVLLHRKLSTKQKQVALQEQPFTVGLLAEVKCFLRSLVLFESHV